MDRWPHLVPSRRSEDWRLHFLNVLVVILWEEMKYKLGETRGLFLVLFLGL